MVRVLALHHCTSGLIPGPGVTHGLSFLLAIRVIRVFPQVLWFFKNQHFKFQFDLETADKKSHLLECPLLNSNYPFRIIEG